MCLAVCHHAGLRRCPVQDYMYDLSRTKGSHATKPAVAAVHNDCPFLLQQDMSKSVRQRLSQGLRECPDTELTNERSP